MRHVQTASGKTITHRFKLKERTNHYIQNHTDKVEVVLFLKIEG